MGKAWQGVLAVCILLVAAGAVVLYSGTYDIGADRPHTQLVYSLLKTLRDRSIAARSAGIQVPDLDDPALLRTGAEHYGEMCTGCHLAPGMEETELRQGLYPKPPLLAEHGIRDPARAFWVIKHGIKMSGMPAWGTSHDDDIIWGIVALLQRLPGLSAAEFRQLAADESGAPPVHDHHSHDADHDASGHDQNPAAEPAAHVHHHEGTEIEQ